MFPFMIFPTLFSFVFTKPGEQQWICNSSDLSILYSNCDDMVFPISIKVDPCLSVKGSKGFLHLFYIARRDIKQLYFNLHLSIKSLDFPKRREVICRGSDDDYSFCKAVKGETVNTTISFSYDQIRFPKGTYRFIAEAVTGSTEETLFCLNFTLIHHPDSN
ncbi:lymphocyte antigen 96 isoform X1 [Erinaceus europaeus]|uniref:Lymphocyte antigen 96 n=1 Tax=Erinaceus europaeus TaxID=9365 RepID=A0A1S2ZWX9_ERIEU|nr:lymphocyte antigen 96 isoform X1 [Erinaceus europaeus]